MRVGFEPVFCLAVPQGEVQDRHAPPLQSLQLQEPHVLWALWHPPLGPGTAGAEVWRWVPGEGGTSWAWEGSLSSLKIQISFFALLCKTSVVLPGGWRSGLQTVLQGGSFLKNEDNNTGRYLIQKDDELLPKEIKNITVMLYELASSISTVRPKTFHCLHNPKPMGGSSSVIAV